MHLALIALFVELLFESNLAVVQTDRQRQREKGRERQTDRRQQHAAYLFGIHGKSVTGNANFSA